MSVFDQKGVDIFSKTPPFENPAHFNEKGENVYFKNKNVTPCNWVFKTREEYLAADTETSVVFSSNFELVFEDNKANRYNRQYLELEDGRFADAPAVFTYSFGDLFRGSKIVNIYEYIEFIQLLKDNNKNSIADKLLNDE